MNTAYDTVYTDIYSYSTVSTDIHSLVQSSGQTTTSSWQTTAEFADCNFPREGRPQFRAAAVNAGLSSERGAVPCVPGCCFAPLTRQSQSGAAAPAAGEAGESDPEDVPPGMRPLINSSEGEPAEEPK